MFAEFPLGNTHRDKQMKINHSPSHVHIDIGILIHSFLFSLTPHGCPTFLLSLDHRKAYHDFKGFSDNNAPLYAAEILSLLLLFYREFLMAINITGRNNVISLIENAR